MKTSLTLSALLLTATLAGCGYKGPLVPAEPETAAPAPQATAETAAETESSAE